MPYLDQETRDKFFFAPPHSPSEVDLIEQVVKVIRNLPEDGREGACNYAISRIVAQSMKPASGWRYFALNRAFGTFLSAGQEFYRRLVVPYEDKKKAECDLTIYRDGV